MMYYRNIATALIESLSDSPVVLLNGARQTGKSTLVQKLAAGEHPARYITLDDAGVLAAAHNDPAGFLAGLEGPVILDEIQRAPELFLAIKAEVDRERKPGRFLLTGSADVMLLPRLSESLAGRMEIHTLWPLSQGEIGGVKAGFVDALFSEDTPGTIHNSPGREELSKILTTGGYPEAVSRRNDTRRQAWFASYVTTILHRDIRDIANIEGLTALPRLLSLLAARATSLVNFAELSRSSGIPQSTLKRYISLLETTFLVQVLPAWSGNLGKRLVKSPKLIISDTGLLSYLLGADGGRLRSDSTLAGSVLENFVVMELLKQIAWSRARPRIFHFRTQSGLEVDIVLEDTSGSCVGIEVKAASSVGAGDFKGLRALAEALGKRFIKGIVLYTGRETIPFGEKIFALPLGSLWELGAVEAEEW